MIKNINQEIKKLLYSPKEKKSYDKYLTWKIELLLVSSKVCQIFKQLIVEVQYSQGVQYWAIPKSVKSVELAELNNLTTLWLTVIEQSYLLKKMYFNVV